MHINLSSRLRRCLLAAVCLAAVGLYISAIARHYAASRLSAQLGPESLTRAARLEPWNAEPRWQLARYSLFVAQDPADAVSNLQAAVALNPHVARYWLDLAAAYQVSGEVSLQRSALESALGVEPTA